MPQIRKPIAEILAADIEKLCSDRAVEDEQLEFKRSIPFNGDQDPWLKCPRVLSERGRNAILAEIVAFANSYGGDLVVGVDEEPDHKPGRASSSAPIAACADAAHRLAQAASECIEPPVLNLQVRPIPLAENGAGVIVFRVPRSRSAPHRLHANKECYHRVRHETKPMSMRQIQDLTFSVGRSLDQVDARLRELRRNFEAWADRVRSSAVAKHLGVRVACVPATPDCYLDHVHNIDQIRPRQRAVRIQARSAGDTYEIQTPFDVHQWHPILRGSEGLGSNQPNEIRLQVHCDGAVVYEWRRSVMTSDNDAAREKHRPHVLPVNWLFATVVNAIEGADRIRHHAVASATEYAVEIQIFCSDDAPVTRLGARDAFDPAGRFHSGLQTYPRYTLGPADTWPDTLTRIWQDFWNSINVDASGDYIRLMP